MDVVVVMILAGEPVVEYAKAVLVQKMEGDDGVSGNSW